MIIKTNTEQDEMIRAVLEANHHLKIVNEDYEDDGEVYVIEVEEKVTFDHKQKLRKATEESIAESF